MSTPIPSHRLSNEKPSAIFRLRGNFTSQQSESHALFSGASTPIADVTPHGVNAVLGLAIEPLPQIISEVAALPSAMAKGSVVSDATLMAERIVKNLHNYLSSFIDGGSAAMNANVMVPMGMILKWYENFMTKVRNQGVGFLESQD